MKRLISAATLAVALLSSASAFAYDGYVTRTVSLRAGPDSSYPAVARIRRGTSVVIEGCVDDWSWCDVSSRRDRGWISGNYLQHEYQGHRVLIPRYGVQIGIPIISFVFGSYWDDHYRSRSWYRERDRWSRVTPHYERRDHSRPNTAPAPPIRESRPAVAPAQQPSYQTRPQTTTVAPAPQRAPSPPVRTQERTTSPTSPPVDRNVAPRPTPQQDRPTAREAPPARSPEQAKSVPPPRSAPEQAKSPSAPAAAKDKGKDQGDKGRGKDKNKDDNKDKDGGG